VFGRDLIVNRHESYTPQGFPENPETPGFQAIEDLHLSQAVWRVFDQRKVQARHCLLFKELPCYMGHDTLAIYIQLSIAILDVRWDMPLDRLGSCFCGRSL
jgi:hypothetical protein